MKIQSAKPYGFLVTYDCRTGEEGFCTKKFRSKGSKATALRAAVMKRGYIRVVELEEFTEEQFLRCFGEGKM